MTWGVNSVGYDDRHAAASIRQLRGQVENRLVEARKKQGLKDAFSAASRSASEDGFIGGLLFGLLTWTPFLAGMGHGMSVASNGATDHLFDATVSSPSLCAAFDGASMICDDAVNRRRARKVDFYPEGRRQDPIMVDEPPSRAFNLASSADSLRFICDARGEEAFMSELLDMLDELEKHGVTTLRLDPRAPVHATLKRAVEGLRRDPVMVRFSVPLRQAA